MSDTPRTYPHIFRVIANNGTWGGQVKEVVSADEMKKLEIELATVKAERDELKHEVAFRRDDSVALANAREHIRSLGMDLDEKQRPLDAEMSRLNENLIAANDAALLAAMERDKLSDVLQRHGFVRCDIPACNCGSWHPRYGLTERMQEIKDALEEAGHELDNSNGNRPLNALKQLIAERDRMRPVVEAAQGYAHSDDRDVTGALTNLLQEVDTYEAAICPSATAMP